MVQNGISYCYCCCLLLTEVVYFIVVFVYCYCHRTTWNTGGNKLNRLDQLEIRRHVQIRIWELAFLYYHSCQHCLSFSFCNINNNTETTTGPSASRSPAFSSAVLWSPPSGQTIPAVASRISRNLLCRCVTFGQQAPVNKAWSGVLR